MAATEYLKFVFGTLLVIACLSLVIFYVNPSYLMKRSPTQNPTTGGQASPFYAPRSIPVKIGGYDVEELAPGETAGGVYSWSDEPLGPCPDCDEIIKKINAGRVLSPEHEAFISSNLGENRVYVGLTTSPRRVKNIHHIFKNLDLKYVENILLTLPHGYRNKEPYSISRRLVEAFPKVKVLAVPTDYGGATKIIHAMEWVRKTRGALADGDLVISIDGTLSLSLSSSPLQTLYLLSTNISLCLFLSYSFSLPLCLCLSVCLSVCLSTYLYFPAVHVSVGFHPSFPRWSRFMLTMQMTTVMQSTC